MRQNHDEDPQMFVATAQATSEAMHTREHIIMQPWAPLVPWGVLFEKASKLEA